jgi:hypothetical protein
MILVKPWQAARVNRGGSWNNDNPSNVRSANRNRNNPTNQNENLGFRCARLASPARAGSFSSAARSLAEARLFAPASIWKQRALVQYR